MFIIFSFLYNTIPYNRWFQKVSFIMNSSLDYLPILSRPSPSIPYSYRKVYHPFSSLFRVFLISWTDRVSYFSYLLRISPVVKRKIRFNSSLFFITILLWPFWISPLPVLFKQNIFIENQTCYTLTIRFSPPLTSLSSLPTIWEPVSIIFSSTFLC